MTLEVQQLKDDDKKIYTIMPKGDIDVYTVPQLKDAAKEYSKEYINNYTLYVDFEKVNYIDSTGLGVLVGMLKNEKEHDKSMHIINLKDNVKKIFTITGLEKIFVLEV